MSNIPSAKLQIASTRYGQSAHAQNRQFGEVSLESDGRVDDTFRSDKDVYHLSDVADFIEKQHALAQQSLQSARETFETGEGFDQYGAGDKHRQIVRNLAEESGIEGSAYPKTDWRGVVTETNVNLEGSDGRYNGQSLKIENGAEGTTAHLQTRNGDALHTITVPVGEDGKVHLEASSESAEVLDPLAFLASSGRHRQQRRQVAGRRTTSPSGRSSFRRVSLASDRDGRRLESLYRRQQADLEHLSTKHCHR